MALLTKKRRAWLLVALAALLAYLALPFPFLSSRSRVDIQEASIRWLLRHNHSALQNRLQVCYVGLGKTFDPDDKDFSPLAPPPDFLKRFADLPVPVYAVGSRDGAGKKGLSVSAGDVQRWSIGLVRCRGLYFEGSLSSAAYDIYMLRLPFTWLPFGAKTRWLS